MKPSKPIIYASTDPAATVRLAEFARMGERPVTFLHTQGKTDELEQWLAKPPLSQYIVARTPAADGSTVLTCEGTASPTQIVTGLNIHGQNLAEPQEKKTKFDPWKWRAGTSVVGQSLQLASGFRGAGHMSDRIALIGFATLNMTANIMNWIFGAQEKKDPHQLHFLKEQINRQLAPIVGEDRLPDVGDQRMKLRPNEETHKSTGQKTYEFLQKYSVTGGEIGLRVIGAMSLAFPILHWKGAFKTLQTEKSLGKAYAVLRNQNPVTYHAGLITLAGKFTSLLSAEPDPYDPKPHGIVDNFREKIAFPLSSIIEGGAAGWMTHDRFATQKMRWGGKHVPDYLGGTGNAVFVGGYVIRFNAPYGSLKVDMPELYAHISDGLAHVPREKLPELLAQTSIKLAEHFKNPQLTAATIYAAIATDLKKQHRIDLTAPAPAALDKPTRVHQVAYQDRVAPDREPALHH